MNYLSFAWVLPLENNVHDLHETIYREARDSGARSSDQVRTLIGLLLSHRAPEPIFKPLWKAPRIAHCIAGGPGSWPRGDFEFRAIDEARDGENGLGIYFETFRASMPLGRISAFIPGASLDSLMSSSFREQRTEATERLFGGRWHMEFTPVRNSGPRGKFRIRAWKNEGSAAPPSSEEGGCLISYP